MLVKHTLSRPLAAMCFPPANSHRFATHSRLVAPTHSLRTHARLLALVIAIVPAALAGGPFWTPTSGPTGGRMNAFATHDNVIFAATNTGVYASTDAGVSWMHRSADIPSGTLLEAIAAGHGVLLAGGSGLYRSSDAGESWLAVEGFESATVRSIEVSDAGFFVHTSTPPAVWESQDAGATWEALPPPGFDQFGAIHVTPAGTLLGASAGGLGTYRFTPQNPGWTLSNSGQAFGAFGPLTSDDSATFIAASSPLRVLLSTNDGLTWSPTASTLAGTFVEAMHANASHVAVLITAFSESLFYRSSNQGASWESISSGLPATQLFALHSHAGHYLAGTRAGAWRLESGQSVWTESNAGFAATSIRALAASESTVYCVRSDRPDAVYRSTDGGATWITSTTGIPVGAQIFSLTVNSSGAVLAGTSRDGVLRSLDGGLTWHAASTGLPTYNGSAGLQFTEIQHIAEHNGALFAATGGGVQQVGDEHGGGFTTSGAGVFRSVNGGTSWQPARNGLPTTITDLFGTPIFSAIYSLESTPSGLYAAVQFRGVYRTLDNGANWTPINAGVPTTQSGAFSEPNDFVTSPLGLLAAHDDGVQLLPSRQSTWIDSSAGLPAGRTVAALHEDERRLYAAVSGPGVSTPGDGVYASTDGGATWFALNTGLDAVPTRFASTPAETFVGTLNRGVWRLTEPTLASDLDGDGDVDLGDLGILLADFGCDTGSCAGDIDGDGATGLGDLGLLLSEFGQGA